MSAEGFPHDAAAMARALREKIAVLLDEGNTGADLELNAEEIVETAEFCLKSSNALRRVLRQSETNPKVRCLFNWP